MGEMRLPKKVYICGIPYKIKYLKEMVDTDADREEWLLGQTRHNPAEIRVFKSRTKEQVWQTIWHEVFHAMFYQLKLWRHIKGGRAEELLADGLSLLIQGLRWEYDK